MRVYSRSYRFRPHPPVSGHSRALLRGLETYVAGQAAMIIDYAAARHDAEAISTALTESAVQWLLHRRMGARQQMRWSPRGARMMLRVRTAVANGTFERDYAVASAGHDARSAEPPDPPLFGRSHAYQEAVSLVTVFRSELPRLLDRTGPFFATLKVDSGDPSPQDYATIHGAETRRRFKQAIAGSP